MTILASDTFIRANQSGWGTASDGETWAFYGATATEAIASNEGTMSGSAAGDVNAQLGTGTAANQEVLCRIAINNANDICGVQARYSGGATPSNYKLLFYGGNIHINKAVSGTSSNLVNYSSFTMTLGTFYWFHLQVVGTTVRGNVWQDGTAEPSSWMLSTTDSSVASGGFAVLGNNGAGTAIQFDHFSAGDVTVSLSATFAGVGTLTLSLAHYLTATWITRDTGATWKTRDGITTWKTRDEVATWKARQ